MPAAAFRWLVALGLALAAFAGAAQPLLPVPALTGPVIDQTGTLDAEQAQALTAKLRAFEQSAGAQVVVLLVPTTQPEDIASYANRVANSWKIGRRDVGDGLLLVVAKNDRKVRIEVAKTLEGAIPDLAAKRVIDEAITPRFRAGDFAGGIDAAVDRLLALIRGEALPAPTPAGTGGGFDLGFDWEDLAVFLFIAVPVGGAVLRSVLGRKLGSFVTGLGAGALTMVVTASFVVAAIAGVAALLFTLLSQGLGSVRPGGRSGGLTTGGWSSGSSSGSSDWGGGFSSGGGGDFGGGGASGDW